MASRAEPSGTLKVTAPPPIWLNILAPAIPRFRERYPKLAIDLRLGDQFVDIVAQGIDVAIWVSTVLFLLTLAGLLTTLKSCYGYGYLNRIQSSRRLERELNATLS